MKSLIHAFSEVAETVFPPEAIATVHYWFVPIIWGGFLFALALSAVNRRD